MASLAERESLCRGAVRPYPLKPSTTFLQRSGEIETVRVHHLGPRRHEVLYELLLRVSAPIDLREGTQLRVRTEDQIKARAGPLDLFRLPVAALIHAIGVRGLPIRAHTEQVDEEVVRQRLRLLGEGAVLGPASIRTEHAQAADKNRHLRPRQPEQLRPIDQSLLRLHELVLLAVDIVAEAVGTRFERREGG